MKPQCTTAAECLRELARVMEQFLFICPMTALSSKYVKYDGYVSRTMMPAFTCPEDWQFAIAEVEGKPVFIGDELYDVTDNKFTVEADYVNIPKEYWNRCSWKPPRPKTVMVELTVEDAEYVTGKRQYSISEMLVYARRNEEACKKALEELK